VVPKALSTHKPLHLQVSLLAKGGQLLACKGEQETGFYTKAKEEGVRLWGGERGTGRGVANSGGLRGSPGALTSTLQPLNLGADLSGCLMYDLSRSWLMTLHEASK
jgi:hypothetical protein